MTLSWWPCHKIVSVTFTFYIYIQLVIHAFHHLILLFFPLHMTKPPQPVSLHNTTNNLHAHSIPQPHTSFLLFQRGTTIPPNNSISVLLPRSISVCDMIAILQIPVNNISESTYINKNNEVVRHCGMWPSEIGVLLERNRLRVGSPGSVGYISHVHRSYDYTQVPSGFSGYIWLDTKIVLKKIYYLNHRKHLQLGASFNLVWLMLHIRCMCKSSIIFLLTFASNLAGITNVTYIYKYTSLKTLKNTYAIGLPCISDMIELSPPRYS